MYVFYYFLGRSLLGERDFSERDFSRDLIFFRGSFFKTFAALAGLRAFITFTTFLEGDFLIFWAMVAGAKGLKFLSLISLVASSFFSDILFLIPEDLRRR
jgi:hypothetical protein